MSRPGAVGPYYACLAVKVHLAAGSAVGSSRGVRQDILKTMTESNSQHDAGNDADEYPIAPLPPTFEEAKSPAYRSEHHPPPSESYSLGPEVDDGSYSVGSESWREAAAGVRRPLDEFGLVGETTVEQRKNAQAALRRAIEKSQELEREVRAGAVEDPVRFSLSGLFLLITAASVALAFGSRLPRQMFAGISGGAALLTLLSAKWFKPGSAVLNVAWYVLLLIYVLTSIFAALGL